MDPPLNLETGKAALKARQDSGGKYWPLDLQDSIYGHSGRFEHYLLPQAT
jgi:hypothetical protein